MTYLTADLYDEHGDALQVAAPLFRDFGGRHAFHGRVVTLKVHEDNSLVRETLGESGDGRVLVVDGGGSLRCALLGDNLARMAAANGWSGVVIHGCIRDSVEIARLPVGVKALATHPAKSRKRGEGQRDVVVRFADVAFAPGSYLYADEDGLVVADEALGG
ncbi:MAG: ribonuclease E activity regulator RraA [Gammaproteobacteria bacterium]|nr:ribonuclease E activity regulator RraA [Gammaproteobacteria bacterium]